MILKKIIFLKGPLNLWIPLLSDQIDVAPIKEEREEDNETIFKAEVEESNIFIERIEEDDDTPLNQISLVSESDKESEDSSSSEDETDSESSDDRIQVHAN